MQIREDELPEGWSENARDIINKLIQRKEEIRLGKSGPNEIKDHPWFKDVDWEGIKALKAIPPYIPNIVFNL